jgi:tRNA modification GTPase
MTSNDTICALSSAPGRAGIAVVRVSGPEAARVLEALSGRLPEPRRATLRTILDPATGMEIDRGIILLYPAPASFTGEDIVEFFLHGGRAVTASVLALLQGLGCRLAEPGELARRAFENGKIDLTEAEGIADLIDAETEAQRRQAVAQAGGALHRLYDAWRAELLDAMALTEAAIDFSDEGDVAAHVLQSAREIVAALSARISEHLADGRRGEILRDGFRVVLAGPPNVGKSSLLNALARREAAIVSALPGTTRDVIEVRLDLEGLPVIVSDTAGIREADGEIEREGIRRTFAQGRAADLVLWVVDAVDPELNVPEELHAGAVAVVPVWNKTDLTPLEDQPAGAVRVSAATGEGIPVLVALVAARARERISPREGPVITQARHRQSLEACAGELAELLSADREPELAAEHLRRAALALGRITGRVDAEEVLGRIFGRFCIGK